MGWITIGADDQRKSDRAAAIVKIDGSKAPYYGIAFYTPPTPFVFIELQSEADAHTWYNDVLDKGDAEYIAAWKRGEGDPLDEYKGAMRGGTLTIYSRSPIRIGAIAGVLGIILGIIFGRRM